MNRDLNAPRGLWIFPILACAVLALMTFAGTPASAATSRPLLDMFSTGPGSQPQALASDDAGNIYVLELGGPGGPGLAKFNAAGDPVPFSAAGSYIIGNKLLGAPGAPFSLDPNALPGVAVDSSGGPNDGYIYVSAAYGPPTVYVFDATGAYKGALDSGHQIICGVAVNPTTGEVYTASYLNEEVRRFAPPVGDPATAVPNGRLEVDRPPFAMCGPLAVDSAGAAYVAIAGQTTKFDAAQFEAAAPVGTIIDSDSASALAVDPTSQDIYIVKSNRVTQRNPAGAQVGNDFPLTPLSGSNGVTVAGTGEVSVSEANGGDGGIFVFGPTEVALPLATTAGPSNIGKNSADVAGEVDPDGAGGVTTCEFRYGRDAGYSDGSVPCTPAASVGSPIAGPTAVSANLSGLQAQTHYHYRLFVTNANGSTVGGDQSFDTPAAVEGVTTGDATQVTKDSASLSGSYIADGVETHYYFEYGTTTSYGQTAPAPPGTEASSVSGPQNLGPTVVTGLQGGTEYHYRVVAVNSSGTTFGDDRTFTTSPAITNLVTGPATGITNDGAGLTGSFDADSYAVHYYFEYGTSTAYGKTAPLPPGNEVPAGSGNVQVTAVSISGLEPGSTYHYRIVAANDVGKTFGQDEAFTTATGPSINNLSTASVKATSAELKAVINPEGADTSYRFEYGPTTGYGSSVPIPDGNIGSGTSDVSVSAVITGLIGGTTYHFRVVAQNQYGTETTSDQSFGFYPPACPNSQLRQETNSTHLPDCRAYELVTPSYTAGTTIFPSGAPPATGHATNPSRLAYAGGFGALPGTGDPINTSGDLYVSTRGGSGWKTKYIGLSSNQTLQMGAPPENQPQMVSDMNPTDQKWTQSSPNLDRILNYDGAPPNVNQEDPIPSNAPYVWDSLTNRQIARWPTNVSEVEGGTNFIGTPRASSDLTHFVFSSSVPFTSNGEVTSFPPDPAYTGNRHPCCAASIYDNNTVTGSIELISLRADETIFRGLPVDLSVDGRVIVMAEGDALSLQAQPNTAPAGKAPLFVRVKGRTYDISSGQAVGYIGMSADGSQVYIESADRLSSDDHDDSNDIFVWNEDDPESLTKISTGNGGTAGDTDACSVSWTTGCGAVAILSFDYNVFNDQFTGQPGYEKQLTGQGGGGQTDSSVGANGDAYFISPEQLDGAKGEAGQANLYRYRDGQVRFVARLTSGDPTCYTDPFYRYCSRSPIARIQITPDGKYMAFITSNRVTAYDNAGFGQMYLYSSDSGRVTCVSCLPGGQPPVSDVFGSQNGLFLIEDGRAAFSTEDAVVPQDTDGVLDTYEYVEGRAYLISSGLEETTTSSSGFSGELNSPGLVGFSADGTDLYFATYQALVDQDKNGQEIKIYDARTNGGFPGEAPQEDCQAADECHGPGNAPPPALPDRTSAHLGVPARAHGKKHKAKKKHKARKKAKNKAKNKHSRRANHKPAATKRSGR
jgi:hypothetical protein